jgi:hypothetical protein
MRLFDLSTQDTQAANKRAPVRNVSVLNNIEKKFWQELIAYIVNICYDKDRIENNYSVDVCIFIAAGTCLPSRYLAKIEDYTDTQTVK